MCPWSDCWCRVFPRPRLIVSTGQFYTLEEIRPTWWRRLWDRLRGRQVRRFAQTYVDAGGI